MKILVTGADGYIGLLLAPMLMQRGHKVIGVDTGSYQVSCLYNCAELTNKTINKEIQHISAKELQEIEAVVHIAELANDPTNKLSPRFNYDINHKSSVYLANSAKAAGVRRFVYISSCSVYGVATGDDITEDFPVNPQTTYAVYKTMVEQDVKKMADDNFSPTFLRNATAFGASPKLRFDTILNNMAWFAWTTKEIKMTSDGASWCPLVHVLDICKAIVCVLEAPRYIVHSQIFNVGDSNYQVKEIAEIVAEVFKGCKLSVEDSRADSRNYRVSFEKINKTLPGFKCDWNAQRGTQQLFDFFNLINMSWLTEKSGYESLGCTTLRGEADPVLQQRAIAHSYQVAF